MFFWVAPRFQGHVLSRVMTLLEPGNEQPWGSDKCCPVVPQLHTRLVSLTQSWGTFLQHQAGVEGRECYLYAPDGCMQGEGPLLVPGWHSHGASAEERECFLHIPAEYVSSHLPATSPCVRWPANGQREVPIRLALRGVTTHGWDRE